MRHPSPAAVVLALFLALPALSAAASPASSWFGFRPRDVTVTLTSTPPGAQVHLVASDGTKRLLGTTATPLVVALPPGDHRLVFELAGHEPLELTRTLAGSTASLRGDLQPQKRAQTVRFTVPLGFHSIVYERGPDGRTRILPSTLAAGATAPPPQARPTPDWTRVYTPLPTRAQLAQATLGPTTAGTFFERYRFLEQTVWASGYADLGCSVTEKDVFVLETLFGLNPKKACLRLDAALGKLAAAMTATR